MMKIFREQFFATQIFYKDIQNSVDINKDLISKLYDWKKKDAKGIVRSNHAGWHSAVDMHQRIEYKNIVKEVFNFAKEVFTQEGYHKESFPIVDNMWANISQTYAYNRCHNHPGCLWSGVYYVQTPKRCGNIIFKDPKIQSLQLRPFIDKTIDNENRQKYFKHQWDSVHYEARAGRMILFPAYVEHEVEQNLANEDRISLSFNIGQRFEEGFKPDKRPGHTAKTLRESDI